MISMKMIGSLINQYRTQWIYTKLLMSGDPQPGITWWRVLRGWLRLVVPQLVLLLGLSLLIYSIVYKTPDAPPLDPYEMAAKQCEEAIRREGGCGSWQWFGTHAHVCLDMGFNQLLHLLDPDIAGREDYKTVMESDVACPEHVVERARASRLALLYSRPRVEGTRPVRYTITINGDQAFCFQHLYAIYHEKEAWPCPVSIDSELVPMKGK